MSDLARKEMMNIEQVGMSNDEFRTTNFEQMSFDILRFIIRYLKKAGLGQGAGRMVQGVNE